MVNLLDKIGFRSENPYYPFTREEFLKLKTECSWGQFQKEEKKRLKEIDKLRKERKRK